MESFIRHSLIHQDEELQVIYSDLESAYGAVTFEAWLALLASIKAITCCILKLSCTDRHYERRHLIPKPAA